MFSLFDRVFDALDAQSTRVGACMLQAAKAMIEIFMDWTNGKQWRIYKE